MNNNTQHLWKECDDGSGTWAYLGEIPANNNTGQTAIVFAALGILSTCAVFAWRSETGKRIRKVAAQVLLSAAEEAESEPVLIEMNGPAAGIPLHNTQTLGFH